MTNAYHTTLLFVGTGLLAYGLGLGPVASFVALTLAALIAYVGDR